jgi:hypothetical protein
MIPIPMSNQIRLSRDFSGIGTAEHTFSPCFEGFSVRMSEQQAERMADDPGVQVVEEDG